MVNKHIFTKDYLYKKLNHPSAHLAIVSVLFSK